MREVVGRRPHLAAPSVAGTYLGASVTWALWSDAMMSKVGLPLQAAQRLQIYYTAGFFIVSSLIIYFIVRQYVRRVEEASRMRTEQSMEIARRLAMAIELRDKCNSGHNQRLGQACQVLARELGLDDETVELMPLAAALHDVGKIGVPDAILNKPGPLTRPERETIESHVGMGARLLAVGADPLTQLAHRIALTHHESWDGSGYPNGLAGEEIPIEGRIAALADMFDALISHRPYKEAWDIGLATQEIIRLQGTRFDPEVVAAFKRALPELERIALSAGSSAEAQSLACAS
jgi:putative two-component system response regulator